MPRIPRVPELLGGESGICGHALSTDRLDPGDEATDVLPEDEQSKQGRRAYGDGPCQSGRYCDHNGESTIDAN
jgi:hypothetical protein